MAPCNKIKFRDLDPELQRLLSGQDLTDETIKEILKKYRRKNEYILEEDIDSSYTNALIEKINDVKIDFENFKSSFTVLSEAQLSPEFLQKIKNLELVIDSLPNKQTLENEFSTIHSQIASIEKDIQNNEQLESALTQLQQTTAALDEIKQDLSRINSTEEELLRQNLVITEDLAGKRSSNDPIAKEDLSGDIQSALEVSTLAYSRLTDFLDTLNSVDPGYYMSLDTNGNITSKELFVPFVTVKNGRTLNDLKNDNPKEGDLVIFPESGIVYQYQDKNVKKYRDNGENTGTAEQQETPVEYDFVEYKQFFNVGVKYWNCFLIDYDDSKIFAYITRDGKYVPYPFHSSSQRKYLVKANSSIDIPYTLDDCGSVTILCKETDVNADTYNLYVEAIAYADIAWGEEKSKLFNRTDGDLEIVIIKN